MGSGQDIINEDEARSSGLVGPIDQACKGLEGLLEAELLTIAADAAQNFAPLLQAAVMEKLRRCRIHFYCSRESESCLLQRHYLLRLALCFKGIVTPELSCYSYS